VIVSTVAQDDPRFALIVRGRRLMDRVCRMEFPYDNDSNPLTKSGISLVFDWSKDPQEAGPIRGPRPPRG
jgi:hypothetical protein